jgi:multidrug efflux pump subunit AcrB
MVFLLVAVFVNCSLLPLTLMCIFSHFGFTAAYPMLTQILVVAITAAPALTLAIREERRKKHVQEAATYKYKPYPNALDEHVKLINKKTEDAS